MQCKHIDEMPILLRLRDWEPAATKQLRARGVEIWFNLFKDDERSLLPAFPADTPWKLANAKLLGLKKRGLVDGCGCGCRGDWHITEKGRAHLDNLSTFLPIA